MSHANEVVLEDSNGHIWPIYYYLRGETTHILPGRRQATQVSAIPVRKDEIANYMPWPKVLMTLRGCGYWSDGDRA